MCELNFIVINLNLTEVLDGRNILWAVCEHYGLSDSYELILEM